MREPTNNPRGARPRGALAVAIVLCLAFVSGAIAQTPAIPGPITGEELTRYAERLGLSDGQRLAIESFHAEYRESYSALESTEIEPFLKTAGTLRFGLRMLFDRDGVEATLRKMQQLTTRIDAMDERLFSEVATVLTEEQAASLDAVRAARERRRLGSGPGHFAAMINPGTTIDVADILGDMDLDAATRDDLRAAIDAYEHDLTVALRRLHQRTLRLTSDMFRDVDRVGFDEATAPRAERRQALMSFRHIWSETAESLAREAAKISTLNRRTVETLRLALPDRPGFELHRRYHDKAYRELAGWERPARERFDAALSRLAETDPRREGVASLDRSWRAEATRFTANAADLYDEQRLIPGSARRVDMNARLALQDRKREEKTRRNDAMAAAIAALDSLLADEPIPATGAATTDGTIDSNPDALAAGADTRPGTPGGAAAAASATAGIPPLVLPGPITNADLERAMKLLEFDESLRPTGQTMHVDYLAEFEAILAGESTAAWRRRQRTLWSSDPKTGTLRPPAAGEIDVVYTLYGVVVAELAQADARFFENLDAVAGADAAAKLERIRHWRERDIDRLICTRAIPGRVAPDSTLLPRVDAAHESLVDLSRLLLEIDETDAGPEATAVIQEYDRQSTALLRACTVARLELDQALETLAADRLVQAAAGTNVPYGAKYHELMTGPVKRYRDHLAALTDQNRSTLARLRRVLPEDAAHRLGGLYARDAFPAIFSDDGALSRRFAAALELPGLGHSRRLAIEDLAAAYAPAWEDHCRRLVEVELSATVDGSNPAAWRDRADRYRRLQRINRERDDLNHRTRLQLRALLQPEQAARIGLDADDRPSPDR